MRYSSFSKNSMIGWSAGLIGHNPAFKDFGMYVYSLYRVESYERTLEYKSEHVHRWKQAIFTSKIAHALFKASTSI